VAQRSAVVKAKVAAELQALHVREGDTVRQGQSLGQLDTQEVGLRRQQAQQQAASAQAIWRNAEQTLRNNQALVQQGFISRQALDSSLSNAASTRANYEAAQAAARLADKAWQDTRILAPLGGQVAQRFVQPGERLNVDARIVEIVDLDSLEWQVPLTPQDLARVQVGSSASLRIEGLSEPLQAQVARLNPSATADTRAVMAYLSLPRHPALRQGLFGQGEILLEGREGLAAPASAITRELAATKSCASMVTAWFASPCNWGCTEPRLRNLARQPMAAIATPGWKFDKAYRRVIASCVTLPAPCAKAVG